MKLKIKKNHKRTYLIASALIAILIIASVLIWFFILKQGSSSSPTADSPSASKTTTKEEDGDTDKPNKTEDTPTNGLAEDSGSIPINVSMVIVDANQYDSTFEVRSYVNSLDEGTCTYTFTRGNEKITKQTATLLNGDTTSCSTLNINVSEFAASGDWQLVIDYLSSSKSISGQVKKTVEIQK